MTERNPYSQYNYDTYDQTSQARTTLRQRIASRMSNPVFATVALLLTAAAFAGIIMTSYPDSAEESDVPVIQASAGDLHGQPPANGGLEMPYQDSTVFSNIRSAELDEEPPVEDLLADEKPIDRLEAFAKEAEAMFDEEDVPPAEITESVAADADVAEDGSAPKVIKIPQTVEKIPPLAKAEGADSGAAQVKQPAGSAPETLAFVKSVLNEKDGKVVQKTVTAPTQAVNTQAAVTQPDVQRIEPAAGAAAAAATIASGSYYVQLASVTTEDGAAKEWTKLQKFFSSLQNAQYRVQKADLGERGVRYRIQAGPMNRDIAGSVCDSIKAQKPGGCIVVQ